MKISISIYFLLLLWFHSISHFVVSNEKKKSIICCLHITIPCLCVNSKESLFLTLYLFMHNFVKTFLLFVSSHTLLTSVCQIEFFFILQNSLKSLKSTYLDFNTLDRNDSSSHWKISSPLSLMLH